MTKKIINLVKQITPNEKQELYTHIKGQYTIEEKDGMLRDDILEKLSRTIEEEHINTLESAIQEDDCLFMDIGFSENNILKLRLLIEREFVLSAISIKIASKWKTVADVVTYIENEMESKNG